MYSFRIEGGLHIAYTAEESSGLLYDRFSGHGRRDSTVSC
jgi:hypothetical protein